MHYVNFDDLRLGLQDFFETKVEAASRSLAFGIYSGQLREKLTLFESLKKSGSLPLTDALLQVDGVHDSTGRVIFYLKKVLEELDDADVENRRQVLEAFTALVPSLSTLRVSYEDEVARVDDKKSVLARYESALNGFTIGSRLTIGAIVSSHIDAAEQLGALLSQRAGRVADEKAARTRDAITLRGKTIGLLGRFRQALSDEAAVNPDLPDELDKTVFAFFDQLESNRAARVDKPTVEEASDATGL